MAEVARGLVVPLRRPMELRIGRKGPAIASQLEELRAALFAAGLRDPARPTADRLVGQPVTLGPLNVERLRATGQYDHWGLGRHLGPGSFMGFC